MNNTVIERHDAYTSMRSFARGAFNETRGFMKGIPGALRDIRGEAKEALGVIREMPRGALRHERRHARLTLASAVLASAAVGVAGPLLVPSPTPDVARTVSGQDEIAPGSEICKQVPAQGVIWACNDVNTTVEGRTVQDHSTGQNKTVELPPPRRTPNGSTDRITLGNGRNLVIVNGPDGTPKSVFVPPEAY